ncbi:extracellular solute-binding protein [Arthrobacter alpinus]|nr:extracellular solute-binding protein [Arthrobacter alpinus]
MNSQNFPINSLSRRRLMQLGGVGLGGLVLAGCGASDPGETSTGPLKPGGTPSGQINILDDNTNMVFKDSMIKAFEEKTGIKVATYQQGNFNDLHDKMATMFAAQDSSFDVVMTWAGWSAEFGQAGWLEETRCVSNPRRPDPARTRCCLMEGQGLRPAQVHQRADHVLEQNTDERCRSGSGNRSGKLG